MSTWEEMESAAVLALNTLIGKPPSELRPEALRIGFTLCKRCEHADDRLGDYGGECITLYLETIQEHCCKEGSEFAREVEMTYLHELGHHLGLGEKELESFGL